jgi:hypothetical protein
MASTQIVDAVLYMAPDNQKAGVVPPAEVREDCLCALIQKSYFLVLFVPAVLAGDPCRGKSLAASHE